jgi:hypothetical protein
LKLLPGSGALHRTAWILALFAVAVGLWARFAGLWHRPLAVDEYYFLLSTRSILADWLPDLPGGGYYVRGILIQYLTAGAIALTSDPMLGLRIVPTLFGLGCVALAFVYGSQVGGRGVGLCLAAVILLSSWEVEFSLFGRMYAPLQFFSLLFLVGYAWTLDGRGGWRRYLAPVALLLGIGTHSLALLLVPFVFIPALLPDRLERLGGRKSLALYGLAACAVAAFCFWWEFGFASDLRTWGVTDAFPPDYQTAPAPPGRSGRWVVPVFPFWPLSESLLQKLGLLLGTTGVVALGLVALRRVRDEVGSAHVFVAAAVVAALLHQLLLAGLLGVVVVAHYRSELMEKRALVVGLGLAASIAAAWLAFAALSTYGLGDRSWIAQAGERVFSRALYRTFFAWPDLWNPTLAPWLETVPLLAALLLLSILVSILASARWGAAERTTTAVRHPGFVILCMAVMFGVLNQQYHETRYWFFLYPAMIAAMLLAAQRAAESLPGVCDWAARHGLRAGALGLVAALTLFSLTDDFNPLHLVRITTSDVRYRVNAFQRYETQWYSREDTETPADFVNERVSVTSAEASVIVADVPQASYYLHMSHAVFYPRNSDRFPNVTRSQGTVDFWSGQRLLSTDDELRRYTSQSSVVWVLRRAEERFQRFPAFDIDGVWGERLGGVDRLYISEDGAVEVLRLELREAS